MRATEILSSLQKSELHEFESVIKSGRRESLWELYQSLRRLRFEADKWQKKEVFERIFGQPYNKKKDYLIRNELRLLDQKLYQFMVEKRVMQQLKKKPHAFELQLLDEMLERGLFRQYEIEFRKLVKKLQEAAAHDELIQLFTRHIRYLMEEKEILYELLEEVIACSEELEHHNILAFNTHLRQAEMYRAFAQRSIQSTRHKQSISIPKQQLDLSAPSHNDSYSLFLYEMACSYGLKGEVRIQRLQQAQQHLAQIPHIPQFAQKQGQILASIALEYFLMGAYEQADAYYQQLFPNIRQLNQRAILAIIFNYFSNLLKLQKYEAAIELFEAYEEEILANDRVKHHFLCVKAMCHVFLGQADKAYDSIASNIRQRAYQNYHYYRMVLVIVYCMRGMYEDAEREAHNLKRSLKSVSEEDFLFEEVIEFLGKYAQIEMAAGSEQARQKQALASEIDAYQAGKAAEVRDFLPLLWLRGRVIRL